jgi:hypothetical protein
MSLLQLPPYAYATPIILLLLYGLTKLLRIGRRPTGFPPGPPTIPILGNLHLVLPFSLTFVRFGARLMVSSDAEQEATLAVSKMGRGIRASSHLILN